jgi:dinuclear metal center YbgI/SA1388 family protein
MNVGEIISVIEVFAAPELQEDYDNAGLITGTRSMACTGVMITLDITEGVVDDAIAHNCNLIVAHHPIIFRGLKRINGSDYVQRVVIKAIKNDIALFAAHTNIDNVVLGVNGMIARKLQLNNTRILQPKNKMLRRLITFAPVEQAEKVRKAVFEAGAGHIGKYSECSFNSEGTGTFKAEEGADPYVGEIGEQHHEKETKIEIVFPFFLENQVVQALISNHPYEEVAYDIFTMENVHFGIGSGIIGELERVMEENDFLQYVKKVFGLEAIRHTAILGKAIKRVAVCGGAGSFLIKKAISGGADAYITADVKYHEFFDADSRLLLIDIGHYESEQYTCDLFNELLRQKFPTFAVLKTSVNTNPVHYFIGTV